MWRFFTVFFAMILKEHAIWAKMVYPWSFDMDYFGGPDFWGLMQNEWKMCANGKMQSPVNIDPTQLLYDPHLLPIKMSDLKIEAQFENTGQLPILTIQDSKKSPTINISGGPVGPYSYKLHQLIMHFGSSEEGEKGSEHTVDRVRFPAELQMLAYNADLYENFSVAQLEPRGLLAISVIVDIGKSTNSELRRLTVSSQSIKFKGTIANISDIRPANLLPKTSHYVTYEGSLTFPGCYETVTWVIMNNPIYITNDDLQIWNDLHKTTESEISAQMTPSYRPLRPLNGRLLRTNINIGAKNSGASENSNQIPEKSCPSNIYVEMGYRANPGRTKRGANQSEKMGRKVYKREVFEIENIVPENEQFQTRSSF